MAVYTESSIATSAIMARPIPATRGIITNHIFQKSNQRVSVSALPRAETPIAHPILGNEEPGATFLANQPRHIISMDDLSQHVIPLYESELARAADNLFPSIVTG